MRNHVLASLLAGTLLASALPERNRQEFADANDTDFAHAIPDVARFRINLFRDVGPTWAGARSA